MLHYISIFLHQLCLVCSYQIQICGCFFLLTLSAEIPALGLRQAELFSSITLSLIATLSQASSVLREVGAVLLCRVSLTQQSQYFCETYRSAPGLDKH